MQLPGRFLLWLLLAGLVLPPASVARDDGGSHGAEPAAERLLELAAAGRGDELAAMLGQVRERSDWSDARRESVLYRFATGVRRLPPERVPVAQLEKLTDYEPRVLVAHPESRGALMLPRFDIAGAAAGSIEHAQSRLRVTEFAGRLASSPAAFWTDATDGGPGALAPREQADMVARVAPGTLRAGREAMVQAWRDDPRLTPALSVAALRLADGPMARALLDGDATPPVLRLVNAIPEAFPPDEALALLTDAAGHPALASAAVMGLGRLAPHAPAARDWLERQLDDARHGPSAAAALARLGEPSVVDKAARSLAAPKTQAGLRNRLLLLHLSDTPAARRALSAFAEDPAMPAGLRREVRQWQ